jgi:hypothetical protein
MFHGLGLLKAEDIWIVILQKLLKKPFVPHTPDAIHIP